MITTTDLPDIKNSKIGIIYVYYERKNEQKNQTNLSFFLKYGLANNKWMNLDIESLFVINGHQCEVVIPTKPNIHILKQDNCSDLEGWLNGIQFYENKYNKPIWTIFDYLCLINAGSFGPIYDENINDHWLIPFYNRMKKYNAVIASPCISFLPITNPSGPGPKVVPIFSLLRCTKHIITILTTKQISCTDDLSIETLYYLNMLRNNNKTTNTVLGKKYDKQDAVLTGEYGLSRMLIKHGYKLTSLLYDFDCHDEFYWNINNNIEPDRFNSFNGINIPLSTIFVKNIWRLENSYASLPLLYDDCIHYMYSKLNMTPVIKHNNLNYTLLKYEVYHQWNKWSNKEEFYNNYGYAEEPIIFNKLDENYKDCVIYAHYDEDNIIKDYVIQSLKILLELGYEIIFYTASDKITNIDETILPFPIHYYTNIGDGTDWLIWQLACKNIVEQNKIYEHILLLNDSILLPINGIDKFKNTIQKMRDTSDFWGHWESNEIQWHIIGTPIEFKYKMIHDILSFFNSHIFLDNSQINSNIICDVEVKFATYLCNKGYKHNTVVKINDLDQTVTCPVFNPINIYKWINHEDTFAIKWKYMISYLKPESPYLNYLTRFL
jgi:hypothetical protein